MGGGEGCGWIFCGVRGGERGAGGEKVDASGLRGGVDCLEESCGGVREDLVGRE